MTIRKIFERDWEYDVLLDDRLGEYFLDVICGSAAMYTVRIRLTSEESESFRRNPMSLDRLAREVAFDPDRFAARRVVIDDGE